jgi:hypothetical protein
LGKGPDVNLSLLEELKARGFVFEDGVDYAPAMIKRGPHGLCLQALNCDMLDEESFGQGALPTFALVHDPEPDQIPSEAFQKIYDEQPKTISRARELLEALDGFVDMMRWSPPNAEGDRPGVLRAVDDKSIALAACDTSKGVVYALYWDKVDRATAKVGSKVISGHLDIVQAFKAVEKIYEPQAAVINAPAF